MDHTAARSGPLHGRAVIPGDKSCSHRALILGAMARGDTVVSRLLASDDVLATVRAVSALGARVVRDSGTWIVSGGDWRSPAGPIDCGNSGTLARLLAGAVASRRGVVATLVGDPSLSGRPMRRLIDPLRRMGARIEGDDRLPITVHGGPLGAVDHRNEPASAQVKTALLLAGLGTDAAVRIVEPVRSRDHGEIMLRQFGVEVDAVPVGAGWRVELGRRRTPVAASLAIPADASSAAYPLVAAAIVPGSAVEACGVGVNPLRRGLYDVLARMSTAISILKPATLSGEPVADLALRHAPLRPCHVAAGEVPAMVDDIPALAVACAYARGESLIEGLDELRHKESDRLAAIVAGLTACGVEAEAVGGTLRVAGRGSVPGGARVAAHGDHRIAMAFLVLGLAADAPVTVDSAEMIATSFPGFVAVLRALGAEIA